MTSVPPSRRARASQPAAAPAAAPASGAPVTGVGVIDKAMDVLRALALEPLDLAGLQAATGLPRATAHRLATALEAHGMVRRDDRGRFCPGFELVRLGRAAGEAFPLADIAGPVLGRLRVAGSPIKFAGRVEPQAHRPPPGLDANREPILAELRRRR